MKKWLTPVLLSFLTLWFAVSTATYSLIGQTNDVGDFVVDRKVQFLFVAATLILLFFTIKSFRRIHRRSKNT